MTLVLALVSALAGGAGSARAADAPRWSLDVLYGPEGKVNFEGSYARGLVWLPDGTAYVQPGETGPLRCDAETGVCTPLYDADALAKALSDEGVPTGAGQRLARAPSLNTPDYRQLLFIHRRRLFTAEPDAARAREVTELPDGHELASLSPDGAYLALVADHDLWSIRLADGARQRLTHDGSPTLLNGKLDWVYQEEIYGRGDYRAHWWSPDGSRLAFLQLDVAAEPIVYLVDHLESPGEPQRLRYPRAGEANPVARLGVVPAQGGEITWINTGEPPEAERLIVRVGFTPDGRVCYQVQDRTQRWLKLNVADPQTGVSRTLLTETTSAWVEVDESPEWLNDGAFVWKAARDGWDHLYLHAADGGLLRRLTEGAWEVRKLHGVDSAGGWVYFSGRRDTPLEEHLYRVALTGGPCERLTEPGWHHQVSMDPTLRRFIDTYSRLTHPPQVALRQAGGSLVRMISENRPVALREYTFSPAEFVRVPNRDGHDLDGLLIRPASAPPADGFPVMSIVYGGPRAPLVRNRWDNRNYLLAQFFAQEGIATWLLDPRASGAAGDAWRVAGRFGVDELADLEDGVAYLRTRPELNAGRIGLMGHSFGGFLTLYALMHSQSFSLGVAAAPVTDWRLYDSIYTERYMGLPAENATGYDGSSIVTAAAGLGVPLLLVHGTLDDNVHVDHSLRLSERLQALRKPFELMLYPKAGHSLHRNARHFHELRWRFIQRNL